MLENLNNWFNSGNSFIGSVEISKFFIVFILFSFIGWISEVLYVGIFFEHKFVNRGFLSGPLCPVYGIGGILILMLPKYLQNPIWVLFITGFVTCSIDEYIAGFILERILHTKLWDYSNKNLKIGSKTIKLHIHGRVCLQNSILFGLLAVVVIKFIQPMIIDLFSVIPDIIFIAISNFILIFFVVDIIHSIRRAFDFHVHIALLKDFAENLYETYSSETWFKRNSMWDMFESIKQQAKLERKKFNSKILEKIEWAKNRHDSAEFFINKFPSLKSKRYEDVLTMLKENFKNAGESGKDN